MNFHFISLNFLLLSVAQASNLFEGGFVRSKCYKGRCLRGCNQTLLEAYKNTNLAKSDKNVNEAETYMMLFTRRSKEHPEYLDECGGSLPQNTYFNPKWDIEIIVHGFTDSVCGVAWMREMMLQLLFRDNYNVILVDWSWGNQLDYYDAIRNAGIVARQIAFMIKNIVKTGISTKKIHFVGHSLGAQISGNAGYYIRKLVGTIVRRITGLDPAGPGYHDKPRRYRLDKSDAKLVDIIHSSAADCIPMGFGLKKPLGHLDFYPNGGSVQLSCIPYMLLSLLKGDITYAGHSLLLSGCYHMQSVQYYKVSINSCKCQFIGIKCDSYSDFLSGKCKSCGADGSNCAVMGMDAEYYPWKKGKNPYYLKTSMSCPYCDNTHIVREGFPLCPSGKRKPKCFSKKASSLPNMG